MLHSQLNYYFAKAVTALGWGKVTQTELEEQRARNAEDMMSLLLIELYRRNCRLIPPKSLMPDKDGRLPFCVEHREVPNFQFQFSMRAEWNMMLEATGRRGAFVIECCTTGKKGMFLFGDTTNAQGTDDNRERLRKDINRIAGFVTHRPLALARMIPPKP